MLVQSLKCTVMFDFCIEGAHNKKIHDNSYIYCWHRNMLVINRTFRSGGEIWNIFCVPVCMCSTLSVRNHGVKQNHSSPGSCICKVYLTHQFPHAHIPTPNFHTPLRTSSSSICHPSWPSYPNPRGTTPLRSGTHGHLVVHRQGETLPTEGGFQGMSLDHGRLWDGVMFHHGLFWITFSCQKRKVDTVEVEKCNRDCPTHRLFGQDKS